MLISKINPLISFSYDEIEKQNCIMCTHLLFAAVGGGVISGKEHPEKNFKKRA